MAILITFAGCLAGEDAPEGSGSTTTTPPGGPAPGGENAPPTAELKADLAEGQAPLLVSFKVTLRDPEGAVVTFELDADGDGQKDIDGSGTDVQVQHNYTKAGTYTANLTASDGVHEVTTSKTILVKPGAGDELPEPITFTGSFQAGVAGQPEKNTHTFELHTLVNNITASIAWDLPTVDLDWELYTPSGVLAHQVHETNEPTGTLYRQHDRDLYTNSAVYLAEFGTWSIVVYPELVVQGSYEITVVFQ